MKRKNLKTLFLLITILTILSMAFFGCAPDASPGDTAGTGDGTTTPTPSPGDTTPTTSDFAGGVFKGPFLIGSTVTIYPLDSSLNQTGVSFSGDIISNDGAYDISGIAVTGIVELVAEGYYFDEITGQVTDNKMTMRAITEVAGTVNINLFTALEYDRVKTLYNSGMSITAAKTQAVSGLMTVFGQTKYQSDSGAINVGTANGAALLAVSSMFAYGRTPAEVQTAITEFRVDFADGTADISALTANAKYIDAADVKTNLENYYSGKGLMVTVPAFGDELWNLYGSDAISADSGNLLVLESASTVPLTAGFGHMDGFSIPAGQTLSFKINLDVSNNSVMMYTFSSGESFTVTDSKTATATGPGYFRIDFGVNYPATPFDFSVTVNNNGVESVVNYQVTGSAM